MKTTRFALVFLVVVFVTGVSAAELTVHYHRPDGDYDGWTLWSWNPDANVNKEISSSGSDAYGLVFKLDLAQYGGAVAKLGLLPKFRNWDGKDDPDRFWSAGLGGEIYILSADKTLYQAPPDLRPRVLRGYVDDLSTVRLVLSQSVSTSMIAPDRVRVEAGGRVIPVSHAAANGEANGRAKIVVATLSQPLPADGYQTGAVSFGEYLAGALAPGKIVDSFYDGRPLGALYAPARTAFRTFAPTATSVTVLLYDTPTGGDAREVAMTKTDNGIWSASVDGDLNGKYYTYRSAVPEGTFEVIDPYSHSNTAHNGRGMIVADATPIAAGPTFGMKDAIVYEMHLRDFTIDPDDGIKFRGKYLGMTEAGTTLAGDPTVSTGLDHLKELGVNTIQIMPFEDFDNNEASDQYNWGYMPFHYFSPDGWYATRRDDATRVHEVKMMVDALHKAGFKVVMDVVNNHTAEGNPEIRMSFNGLAPNYYYRRKDDGSYWNGSGCGNEFRSESPMGRKLIIDSLQYWMKECGVDGFRFDLMGLIDLETVKDLTEMVKALKPDAFVYGEPWAGGQTPIHVTTKGDQRGQGFGVFNDHFRDGLRGSAFSHDPGFLQDGRNSDKVKRGIMGSVNDFAQEPTESINYVEVHDNHTLWDRFDVTMRGRSDVTRDDFVKMDKLAAAILFTSQGVPLIQSGQEMLRTKNDEDNTYNKPDEVNEIHWSWKRDNRGVFDYYKELIWLRRNHPMFHMGTAAEVKNALFFLDDDLGASMTGGAIGYVLNRGCTNDTWVNALVLFNANMIPVTFTIPQSQWVPVVNGSAAGEAPLGPTVTGTTITVPARSAVVCANYDEGLYDRVLKPAIEARAGRNHTFTVSAPNASSVTIAGDFNGWNMNQYPMKKLADGTWTIDLELDKGAHEYKFIADGNWDALNKDNQRVTIR